MSLMPVPSARPVAPGGAHTLRVVLFSQHAWAGIADGSVTMTFRRWKRLQAVAGHRYRTAAGIIEVESVEVVDPRSITDADAVRSGFAAP